MSNKTEILSFDEWINSNGFNFRPEQYDLYKFLYQAGQQSKQDEIDELQKRVDLALNKIDFWVSSENGDAAYVANSIGNILKGEETK